MAVPYVGRALRGWTSRKKFKIVRNVVEDHRNTKKTIETQADINYQPVPQWKVDKKPEGDREWRWWSIIVRGSGAPSFKANDLLLIDTYRFKIMNGSDWSQSGFRKYEAIEDFTDE